MGDVPVLYSCIDVCHGCRSIRKAREPERRSTEVDEAAEKRACTQFGRGIARFAGARGMPVGWLSSWAYVRRQRDPQRGVVATGVWRAHAQYAAVPYPRRYVPWSCGVRVSD